MHTKAEMSEIEGMNTLMKRSRRDEENKGESMSPFVFRYALGKNRHMTHLFVSLEAGVREEGGTDE